MSDPVQTVIDRMTEVCRERKRRVRHRLADMLGWEWGTYPSRAERLPNGRLNLRWLWWQSAIAKHRRAQVELQATGYKPTKRKGYR